MNSFQDPSKKTSITSLLNPPTADVTTGFPGSPTMSSRSVGAVNHRQLSHGQQTPGYTNSSAPYPNSSSYHLRAANWGGPSNIMDNSSSHYNEPSGYSSDRRIESPTAPPPHSISTSKPDIQGRPIYHQHSPSSMPPSETYPKSHGPPMGRHRATSIQSMTGIESGRVWQPPPKPISNNSTYVPAVNTAHPDPRPVSNGLPSQSQLSDLATIQSEDTNLTLAQSSTASRNKRAAGYQNLCAGQPPISEWQSSERASVRLAALELMPSSAPPQPRVAPSFYVAPAGPSYPILVAYSLPALSSQDQVLPPLKQQKIPAQPPRERASSTSSKRQLPESEAYASTPKAKRPTKAKPKIGPDGGPVVPSKRGFNAKKRSEAAHIAAQNAQLTSIADKGKDKASESRSSGDVALPELQFARCMSNRYRSEDFPRCVSCTRRWAGDTCRFQGIRCFIKDQKKAVVAVSFLNAKANEVPVLQFPSSWNVPLKQEHVDRCKKVIAKALLSTLKAEREHLDLSDLIRRARESDVRVTCDTCMTSIFSSSWMCRLCGREACADCFEQVRELTEDRPGASIAEISDMQKKREKHAHSNPFFLSCTRRNEHEVGSFSPMSRFFPEELIVAIKEMEVILAAEGGEGREDEGRCVAGRVEPTAAAATRDVNQPAEVPMNVFAEGEGPIKWSEVYKSKEIKRDFYPRSLLPSGTAGESYVPPSLPEAVTTTPYYKICRFSDNDVTAIDSADKFAKIWAYGEPLVVANILSKFKLEWSPDYFIQEFGDRECLITECEQDTNKKTTIKEFFGQFGKYVDRKDVWKLKDWPPSADFKAAFPKLYKDFSDAVPVPDYVRRDGVYNIGSHFPSNVVAPDLGPKMYNAWAANQNPGSKGSTRLHMDMADAMNVMLYAASCPDGSLGCAVWDIYRAEDSDTIRNFLRKRYSLGPHYDPIHGQQYYLDDLLRAQLYKEYGVCSYRVYQRPGEAIFVPAGCAHQVSNLADSIKIATDYVSPENVDRCTKLTKEFREQNKSKVWKEDVLQLKTMMWFAWLSCCKQEKALQGEGARGGTSPW